MHCLRINIIMGNPDEKDRFGFFEVITDKSQTKKKEQIWIECGPYNEKKWLHDSSLDTAADTFEEAINMLSDKIIHTYGSIETCENA